MQLRVEAWGGMLQRFLRCKTIVNSIDSVALTSNRGINCYLRQLCFFLLVFIFSLIDCLTLPFSFSLLSSFPLIFLFFKALWDSVIVDWMVVTQVDCVGHLAGVACHSIFALTLEERL